MPALGAAAHRVRREMKEAKEEIKAKSLLLREAIEDSRVQPYPLEKFLRLFPGVGPSKIRRAINRAGLRPTAATMRLRELTPRSKERVATCLEDEEADFRLLA